MEMTIAEMDRTKRVVHRTNLHVHRTCSRVNQTDSVYRSTSFAIMIGTVWMDRMNRTAGAPLANRTNIHVATGDVSIKAGSAMEKTTVEMGPMKQTVTKIAQLSWIVNRTSSDATEQIPVSRSSGVVTQNRIAMMDRMN